MLGGYAWLARLADKARAEQAGTEAEYVAYCRLTQGFLQAAGVSDEDFEQLVRNGASDADLVKYFDEHVPAERARRRTTSCSRRWPRTSTSRTRRKGAAKPVGRCGFSSRAPIASAT